MPERVPEASLSATPNAREPSMEAKHAVNVGRNLALLGGVIFCYVRAYLYSPYAQAVDGRVTDTLTNGNDFALWCWVVGWVVAGTLCVLDFFRHTTLWGLSALIGMTIAWGIGYLAVFLFSGFDPRSLLGAVTLISSAVIILGLVIRSSALSGQGDQDE
jgi:hypothetical protein